MTVGSTACASLVCRSLLSGGLLRPPSGPGPAEDPGSRAEVSWEGCGSWKSRSQLILRENKQPKRTRGTGSGSLELELHLLHTSPSPRTQRPATTTLLCAQELHRLRFLR